MGLYIAGKEDIFKKLSYNIGTFSNAIVIGEYTYFKAYFNNI